MAMVAIIVAGVFEVGFAICLKWSNCFTKPVPTVGFLVLAGVSVSLLTWSLREVPIGTAYAIWSGIGAVGTAIVGMAILNDPVTAPRFFGTGLIVAGVIVLNLFSSSAAHG